LSTPVSVNSGPYATNTLASKKFLLIYFFIIWGSILPLQIESFIFWKFIKNKLSLLLFLLPFQICIGYLILIGTSLFLSRFLLTIINSIHKPRQGIFKKEKQDKDYYFWSLRAVVKKWPIWLTRFIPSSYFDNLILKLFGVKTHFSNNISYGNIDLEFIELGKNISLGIGSSLKSSIILRRHLIIRKIKIEDDVIIGSNSFISPGTHIGSNTILGAMSTTKFNQKLEANSIFFGDPLEKLRTSSTDSIHTFKNMDLRIISPQWDTLISKRPDKKPEEKFVKNLSYNLFSFAIIYFTSNCIPILAILYLSYEFLIPYFLNSPNLLSIFIDFQSLLTFLLTPLFLIILPLINIFIVILMSKVIYGKIKRLNLREEGIFHWNNKSKDFIYYFKRSFILRYIKWKINKSPFPWLIKPAFNFIGNCHFGKNTIIENSYIAKEFLDVGKNAYLGRGLLANHLWDINLTIKRIVIGDNVEIFDNCCIAPGTEISKNTTLLPLTITSKFDKLAPNAIYHNVPLNKITEEDLSEIYNIIISDFKKIVAFTEKK
jgi:acetyltransferase-like isoleucine patch superfamily enzyme